MEYYLDNAATTKISEQALAAYMDCATKFYANPSANHSQGILAHKKLEECRASIAQTLNVNDKYIYFTSGGTESNSIVLSSLLWSKNPGEIIISKIEHASAFEFVRILKEKGWSVKTIEAPNGFVKPKALEKAITDKTRLVCIQSVNNVIGSIQDIKALVKITREKEKEFGRKIHFHTDAVQAVGKIPFDFNSLDVDSASISAHKFHGPRGIGILYLRLNNLQPLSKGGGQEKNLRGGTENLPAIVAMDVALKQMIEKGRTTDRPFESIYKMNDYLRENLKTTILSPKENYSPFILCFSVAPFPSEVFTRMLNDEGFLVSSGSACSNNVKSKGENVLLAMNFSSNDAKSSIRVSFSDYTTMDEVKLLADKINELYKNVLR